MLHQEYKGPHMTPGGVKGQGPLWKSGGSTPKAINLQDFRGILKLLLSAFTVNLKKKKASMFSTTASIINDHYFHLHTLIFTEKHFPV